MVGGTLLWSTLDSACGRYWGAVGGTYSALFGFVDEACGVAYDPPPPPSPGPPGQHPTPTLLLMAPYAPCTCSTAWHAYTHAKSYGMLAHTQCKSAAQYA